MGTIVAEIALCLLIAAFIGGIVGWLLRSLSDRDREPGEAAVGLADTNRELEGLRGQIEAVEEETHAVAINGNRR